MLCVLQHSYKLGTNPRLEATRSLSDTPFFFFVLLVLLLWYTCLCTECVAIAFVLIPLRCKIKNDISVCYGCGLVILCLLLMHVLSFSLLGVVESSTPNISLHVSNNTASPSGMIFIRMYVNDI